jgi:hypothetical protein
MYVYSKISTRRILWGNMLLLAWQIGLSYIDLMVHEPLLQIIIDSFVRDLTDQSKIRNPHLLLLCCIESGLLDIRLAAARRRSSSAILGFWRLLSLRTSTDPLFRRQISDLYAATG